MGVGTPTPPPPPPSPRPKYAPDPAFINVNHCIFNSLLVFLILILLFFLSVSFSMLRDTIQLLRRDPVKTFLYIKAPAHQTVQHHCALQRTIIIYLFIYLILFFNERCEFFSSRENAKVKRCLKNLIDSDCNFAAPAKEALELAYSDYSPFCANNRDLGATGNDQCHGVQDKNGDALKYLRMKYLMMMFVS